MRIKNDSSFLAAKFVKPNWTECYFSVEDIGHFTCWGLIRERGTHIVRATEYYSLLEDWEPYSGSIFEFIRGLPETRNEA